MRRPPTDTSLLDASEHSDEETPTTPAPQELAIVELELSDPAELSGATATATLRFDQEGGAVCYQFDVEGLQAPYTGWIERGPTGVAGTMIADLGQLSEVPIGCAPVAALDLDQILNDPAAYQVAIG
jgi:hypothetical protein